MPSDDRGIESSGMESATFLIMVAERVEWEACGVLGWKLLEKRRRRRRRR
jgi:hypothetical protein